MRNQSWVQSGISDRHTIFSGQSFLYRVKMMSQIIAPLVTGAAATGSPTPDLCRCRCILTTLAPARAHPGPVEREGQAAISWPHTPLSALFAAQGQAGRALQRAGWSVSLPLIASCARKGQTIPSQAHSLQCSGELYGQPSQADPR